MILLAAFLLETQKSSRGQIRKQVGKRITCFIELFLIWQTLPIPSILFFASKTTGLFHSCSITTDQSIHIYIENQVLDLNFKFYLRKMYYGS